jgi:O-antigen ligase
LAIFLLVLLAILLTGSRAGFLGLLMGLLFFVLFKRGKIWVIAFSGLLIGYFIVTSFPEYFSLLNRGEDLTSSFGTRYEIWKEGVQIFLSNPLLGIGIGNHHYYIVNHSISGYYLIDDNIVYYGTENGYLQFLIECGLLGFIFLFFFIINPIIEAVRSYRNSNNLNIILIISALISWLTAFVSINSLSDKRILVVVVTLVCLLVVARKYPEVIHG